MENPSQKLAFNISSSENSSQSADYIFSPSSIIWRVSRELTLLLGGPSAAILQIAYPDVALGVAAHSDFRRDTIGRLRRTLNAVYTIIFSKCTEVQRMAVHVQMIHKKVQGNEPQSYSAFSEDAQMWVLATLIQLSVEIYERFIDHLRLEEREAFYREMRIFGCFFGLSPQFGPQNWKAFEGYYQQVIHSGILADLPICLELANHIAYPKRPFYLRIFWPITGFLAAEFLPISLREKLGLPQSKANRLGIVALNIFIPFFLKILPASFRYCSHYLKAIAYSC